MKKTLIAIVAMLVLSPMAARADLIYQTVDFGQSLGTVDTVTGLVTTIGSFGASATYGNAFDLDGTLYVTANSSRLGVVDMTTGAVTILGNLPEGMYAIEIDSTGTLYGLAWSGNLHILDKSTGASLGVVGNVGIGFTMDIAFDSNDNLFGVVSGRLFQIDTLTGALISNVVTSLGSVNMGISFDASDTLWATTHTVNSGLYILDVATGISTLVHSSNIYGPHGGDIYVARAVPEPGTLALLGAGLVGIAFSRRRKKA